jgi:hypothetical protein
MNFKEKQLWAKQYLKRYDPMPVYKANGQGKILLRYQNPEFLKLLKPIERSLKK